MSKVADCRTTEEREEKKRHGVEREEKQDSRANGIPRKPNGNGQWTE